MRKEWRAKEKRQPRDPPAKRAMLKRMRGFLTHPPVGEGPIKERPDCKSHHIERNQALSLFF